MLDRIKAFFIEMFWGTHLGRNKGFEQSKIFKISLVLTITEYGLAKNNVHTYPSWITENWIEKSET